MQTQPAKSIESFYTQDCRANTVVHAFTLSFPILPPHGEAGVDVGALALAPATADGELAAGTLGRGGLGGKVEHFEVSRVGYMHLQKVWLLLGSALAKLAAAAVGG